MTEEPLRAMRDGFAADGSLSTAEANAKVAQHLFFRIGHGREEDDDAARCTPAARRKRRLRALQIKTVQASLQQSLTEMLKQPAVSGAAKTVETYEKTAAVQQQ